MRPHESARRTTSLRDRQSRGHSPTCSRRKSLHPRTRTVQMPKKIDSRGPPFFLLRDRSMHARGARGNIVVAAGACRPRDEKRARLRAALAYRRLRSGAAFGHVQVVVDCAHACHIGNEILDCVLLSTVDYGSSQGHFAPLNLDRDVARVDGGLSVQLLADDLSQQLVSARVFLRTTAATRQLGKLLVSTARVELRTGGSPLPPAALARAFPHHLLTSPHLMDPLSAYACKHVAGVSATLRAPGGLLVR